MEGKDLRIQIDVPTLRLSGGKHSSCVLVERLLEGNFHFSLPGIGAAVNFSMRLVVAGLARGP
jgi:hypothetical protein